ncbi:MAG: cytidylate kinase family protein [Candidatus Uhrbacteria bacterium]|nr:cytidylate kinase family protein [Candidatus Uhrbacteria bacterium]
MIITISGVPGSGKTSAGKIVAEKLGLRFYSIGGLRAKMAEERGVTIDELNAIGEKDHTTDTDVDAYQKKLGETEDNIMIEGRLSWHCIPNSFKIFLDCDRDEAARRIYLAKQRGERSDEADYASVEDARKRLDDRMASDTRRYQAIYGVDYQDPSHYDLVVDTTKLHGAETTANAILDVLKTRKLA